MIKIIISTALDGARYKKAAALLKDNIEAVYQDRQDVSVEVMDSIWKIYARLDQTNLLILVTGEMMFQAEWIKKSYPKTRVVVFTNLVPDDEVQF